MATPWRRAICAAGILSDFPLDGRTLFCYLIIMNAHVSVFFSCKAKPKMNNSSCTANIFSTLALLVVSVVVVVRTGIEAP